jgi:mersacidin/lichenicidin family type 2 lantibiotic
MTTDQIVSSWKNEDYRLSLRSDQQALLPRNPAGLIELTDEELLGIDGASASVIVATVIITSCLTISATVAISHYYCPSD